MRKALLIGCGRDRRRKICPPGLAVDFSDAQLTTLDMGDNCGADVVWNLDCRPLPFADDEFDELHAYDVLEHLGKQGDWQGYFDEFAEYWRILKPGGCMYILVPIGGDAFADPGHTRFFGMNHFGFLRQSSYEEANGCTDYRWYWKKNFEMDHLRNNDGHHISAILRKA